MANERQDEREEVEVYERHGEGERKLPAEEGRGERTRARPTFRPRVDIYETDEGLVLVADVPGARREGLDLTLEKRVLTLRARVEDHALEGMSPLYREYQVGDYERSFQFSGDFDAENISAHLKDGVLTLRVPKAPQAQARKIEVRAS